MILFDTTLNRQARKPLRAQLADLVSEHILAGRLPAGTRLPGTRSLAGRLDVDRMTVVAAYDELAAQGWIVTRERYGSVVADVPPSALRAAGTTQHARSSAGFAFEAVASPGVFPHDPTQLPMGGGMPDMRLFPVDAIAAAYRRAVRKGGGELLAYGDPQGLLALRERLANQLIARRNVVCSADNILITRGSQMAIALTANLLLRPGDVVAVEAYGYPPAMQAFRRAGATLLPVEVDDEGMVIDQLERAAQSQTIRAVYVTPHHQYPTMALMSPRRRQQLLQLAADKKWAILEDDYDNEFQYDGRPVYPLAANDPSAQVIYVGTLSKVLAPAMRIGFVVAAKSVIVALSAMRACMDRQGDQVAESAVAEWIEDGDLDRHVRRMTVAYAQRREVLFAALERHLSDRLSWTRSMGGLAVWARILDGTTPESWQGRAARRGVHISVASRFAIQGDGGPFLRIGFAALTPEEIIRGVQALI